jgi:hypothetical protein
MWLNPPYATAIQWTDKAIAEYDSGNISEAVLLVKPNKERIQDSHTR